MSRREIFDYGYSQVATVIDRTEANTRQLITRARKHLDSNRPEAFPVEPEQLAELLAACAHDGGRRRQIGTEPSLAWLSDPAAPAPAGKPSSTPFEHHASIR